MLVEGLYFQLKLLQEKVSSLHSVRSNEKELNWVISKEKLNHSALQKVGQAEHIIVRQGSGDSFSGKGWGPATSCTRRITPAPPVDLQL